MIKVNLIVELQHHLLFCVGRSPARSRAASGLFVRPTRLVQLGGDGLQLVSAISFICLDIVNSTMRYAIPEE